MLIRDEIQANLNTGRLVPVKSHASWSAEPRAFLLERELAKQIADGQNDKDMRDRWAKLEADMAHFVEGGYVNWGLMKWLDPKEQEVWELKSVRPRPSMRVFGRFAEPNVFIGTNLALRPNLKGKWSLQYWDEIFKAERVWSGLFARSPFSGENYTDYITENAGKRVEV